MERIRGKRVLLGVTGGIAAYKAAELVRLLRRAGADVRVAMTPAACQFITPLTLQALSGHPVRTDLMDNADEAAMGHIELARWADLLLVAPASADFIARLAVGMADDLPAAVALATAAPVAVAPAMNHQMWSAAATRQNIETLRNRGVRVVGPDTGDQACGEAGPGRLVAPEEMVAAVAESFGRGLLEGVKVMVTAGPTREPLDPVRYISNRSSGRMGFAIAEAAASEGAEVVLIAGPVALATPTGVAERVDVETAMEMADAVDARQCDLFVGVAAVAEDRAGEPAQKKIKKDSTQTTITLVRNPDVVARVARRHPHPFTVGFAAETQDLEANARAKLQDKGLDAVAANLVGERAEGGFEGDYNALHLYWSDGSATLPLDRKPAIARELVVLLAGLYERWRGRSG